MRYRNNRSNSEPRNMYAKYAGKCACCGADIKVGEYITYYPARREIAHVGGLDGNSARCSGNIAKQRDAGFIDIDRAYEDKCADICGR